MGHVRYINIVCVVYIQFLVLLLVYRPNPHHTNYDLRFKIPVNPITDNTTRIVLVIVVEVTINLSVHCSVKTVH